MKKKTTTTIEEKGNKKITTIVTEETIVTNEITQLAAVLDRSYSMNDNGFIDVAISKFNEYVNGQKALPGKATISVFLFDDRYEVVYDNIDLQKAENMTKAIWTPRGMTRLNDAIGKTITTISDSHSKMKPEDVPSKVLVVILTDGHENDSREFTSDAIKKLIKEKEAKNWNFIFLGADQSAFAAADKMGISRGNTMAYSKSASGAEVYTQSLYSASVKYRSASANDISFGVMSKSLMVDDQQDEKENLQDNVTINNGSNGTFNTTDILNHTTDILNHTNVTYTAEPEKK